MTPTWILDAFAALMLAVASVSAARLGSVRRGPARSRRRVPGAAAVGVDVDAAHLVMGVAMAGMLAPSLVVLPRVAWVVIFGLLTAWFAWRVARDACAHGVRALAAGHCVTHLVHGASMLYMFLALGDALGNSVAGSSAPQSVAPGNSAPGGPGMGAMAAAAGAPGTAMHALEYPTLAFAFALVLVGYSIWDLDQLSGRRPGPPRAPTASAAPPGIPAGTSAGVRAAPGSGEGACDSGTPRAPAGRGRLLSPAITVGSRIVMGVTMAFMLLLMI